ncbi:MULTISPECIES: RDD family protein [unclassified Microcoleus]|uniref:RDD family protein n=1 Tax=unclassified Microcoleus TaxID=2642155 RepID=UPI002FD6C721
MQHANIGKRFLAFLLDLIIWLVLTSIIYGLVSGFLPAVFPALFRDITTTSPAASDQLFWLIFIIVGWPYHSINHSSPRQATLGKRAFGLIICDLNENKISFGRATGRYFCFVLFTTLVLVDFLPVPFTDKSQALHDLITRTVVIER